MTLRRKLRSSAGEAHCNAESTTHQSHVKQRKERGAVEWVPVPSLVSPASATDEFSLDLAPMGLPLGECFRTQGKTLEPVSGTDFEDLLSHMRRERGWYWQPRKLKHGRQSVSKRSRKNPVTELTVGLSPAESLFLRDLAAPEIREKMHRIQARLAQEVTETTGWDLVGSSIHYDSSRPHFNFYLTRVTSTNALVGLQRLRTVGPWTVGQWRLAKLGVGGETGNAKLLANLKTFQKRHGADSEPLDLRLHRILDEQFETELSDKETARLNVCKEHHRQWKAKQRATVAAKQGHGEALAMALLQVVKPFLPPPLRMALNGVSQIAAIIKVIRKFIEQEHQQELSKTFHPSL